MNQGAIDGKTHIYVDREERIGVVISAYKI